MSDLRRVAVATGVGTEELELVADLVDSRLPWLSVRAADDGEPDLPWSCADVIARQQAESDPTGPWRHSLAAALHRQYRVPPPPATPAAFVLQWYLEVPATLLAYAAHLGPWLVDANPRCLSFDLHPTDHFPATVQFRRVSVAPGPLAERLGAARGAYEDHVLEFVEGYAPDVKMGSRQREGMVRDVWSIAVERAAAACVQPAVGGAMRRESCCFIFALPGARECAGCPRAAEE